MKNVIVTGANGFVGSHLVRALDKKHIHVFAVVKDENENIDTIQLLENVEIVYCDLFTLDTLKEKIRVESQIDAFYHLAWAGTSGDARANYELQLNNAKAACEAVRLAKEMAIVKFIFAGSIMEYECEKYIPKDLSRPGLGNIYSTGKVAAHYMAKTLAYSIGLDFEAMIISNIYGPGEISARLINTTLSKMLHGEKTSFTKGVQLYDFIYITDAVNAMILIGEKGQAYKNYYIGNREQKPLKQFIIQMRDCIDPCLELGFGEIPFNGPMLTYKEFNTQALYDELDFEPKVSFQEGIKKTIEWLRERE
ncbi:Nucleoside-diphosphate-sugar epimerase [Eubacterium maltosivorans]|uniref:NAD-dependent epimerase/dehydratase family protein n=1 Tax=Eubacterium maltosivorans TaxID=2041044 RepID=UPI0008847375|nr:NAD(P)-dependent oxidoreductase [Eubacterium maltosivorans]WPK80827.1 dTDP-4-oxo-6-deoxy-D-allose reductase [Eubacterium maltosivorans]SDO32364.1 Nucleoside-diphosphate-sugar epimerase [Eubacterium maltosivorans]